MRLPVLQNPVAAESFDYSAAPATACEYCSQAPVEQICLLVSTQMPHSRVSGYAVENMEAGGEAMLAAHQYPVSRYRGRIWSTYIEEAQVG